MEADILVNYWMAVQKDKEQFYMVMGQSMKVIGKMVMLMDLEYWLLVIYLGMKVIGLKANIMAKEYIQM